MDVRTIRASAPLRISFVGGGTDFPHYYERHGGAVLSATIDRAAHVSLTPRDDDRVEIRSLDLGHRVAYRLREGPVYDGEMDLAKAAIERLGTPGGLDVDIASDAPPGSGLGGSSALMTACVGALAMLNGRSFTREEVARLAHAIERDDLRIAGGWQDQYAAAFGGFNLIEFGAAGTTVTRVEPSPEALATLREHLLLCYTGAVRTDLGLIDAQIRLFEQGREETIVGMKELHELAYEMRDAVLAADVEALGRLLRHAFESKKRMNPHIAEGTPIEHLLTLAHEAGALGGKVCGAGGGGYLLLACRPKDQRAVREALRTHGASFAPFELQDRGVEATDGATWWRPA